MTYPAQPPKPPPLVYTLPTEKVPATPKTISQSQWVAQTAAPTAEAELEETGTAATPTVAHLQPSFEPLTALEPTLPEPAPESLFPPATSPPPKVPISEFPTIASERNSPTAPIPEVRDLPSFSRNLHRLNPSSPSGNVDGVSFRLHRTRSPQNLPLSPEKQPSNPQSLSISPVPPVHDRSSLSQTPTPPSEALTPIPSDPTPDPFKRPIQPSPPIGTGLTDPLGLPEPLEVTADLQQYDEQRDLFTAEGNVVMRYQGAVIDADWLQVNLRSRLAIGEGNVALTQPERVLRGDRFRYNFAQDRGTIYRAKGEIINVISDPLAPTTLPSDVSAGVNQNRLLSDRLRANQPTTVIPTGGGFTGTVGAGRRNVPSGVGGTISRLRFEAEQVDFYPGGWQGNEVRITNDPFGPEFEVRAETATVTRLSPLQDEVLLDSPRLVFDNSVSLPILKRRFVIDRSPRDPALIQIGFDGRDRGGLYLFRDFEIFSSPNVTFTLTPQYYLQRGFDRRNFLTLDELGVEARLNATLGTNTTFTGIASLTNLNPDTFDADGDPFDDEDGDLRASARLRQLIGTHTLTTEYSFRDRLFNGSLGFRTIHQTAGFILTSPNILLGNTGINLSYQGAANWIEANTDRLDILDPIRENNRASMVRVQGSAALNKAFILWQGEGLPPTPTEGLRFTPVPIVPFVQLFFGLRGIAGLYSRSDPNYSLSLRGTVGLQGQFGHFSDTFFDYTAFNISFSETISDGESPYLFDREVDRRRLSLGFTQQIVGPLRFGIQTSINLRTGEAFSTDYILEYSRRSYGIILQFNPDRELGSLTLRISDFNWTGSTEPFTPIDGGVRRY